VCHGEGDVQPDDEQLRETDGQFHDQAPRSGPQIDCNASATSIQVGHFISDERGSDVEEIVRECLILLNSFPFFPELKFLLYPLFSIHGEASSSKKFLTLLPSACTIIFIYDWSQGGGQRHQCVS
jgi:hypothetical protein